MAWSKRCMALVLLALLSAGCTMPLPPATPPSEPAPSPAPDMDVEHGAGAPVPPTLVETPTPAPPLRAAQGPVVDIRVDATQGPHGGAPIGVDRRLYGMNVADWQPQDYVPEPNATYLAYLAALQPGILRWPAGQSSQEYRWTRDPDAPAPTPRPDPRTAFPSLERYRSTFWSTFRAADSTPQDTPPPSGKLLTPMHVDAFVALARAAKAEPVIAVNLETGTSAEAADMVRYVNVERGLGVRWWQLGNEPDLPGGSMRTPDDYARRVSDFAAAMRDVDPSIQLVGGELMTGAHIIASNGAPDWITPILQGAGSVLDAVSWHYYPLDGSRENPDGAAAATAKNLLQETSADWRPAGLAFVDDVMPALLDKRGRHAPGVEVWVTEYGEDWYNGGREGLVDTHAGALWAAEVLGRFAAHGIDAMAKWIFKSGSDHRYTLLDSTYSPRPSYYAYWLFANHFGDRMVNATSSDREGVNVHASLRDDGRLAVMLVNKGEEPREVALAFEGFTPSKAGRYEVVGGSLDARNVTLNGATLHEGNVAGRGMVAPVPVPAEELGRLRVAPLSLTMLVIDP